MPLVTPVDNGQSKYTFDRVARTLASVLVVAAVLMLLRYLSDVLLPFAAAVALAYLLNPLVNVFEQKTGRRGLAVALTIGGLAILGLAFVVTVVPLVVTQASRFSNDLQRLQSDLAATMPTPALPAEELGEDSAGTADEVDQEKSALGWSELVQGWQLYRGSAEHLPRTERFKRLLNSVSGTGIGDVLQRAIDYTNTEEFNELLVSTAKRVAVGGWTVLAFFVNMLLALTGLVIVFLYLVFLLLDFPEYARTWPSFLPPQYRDQIVEFLSEFNVAMRRYFRGQAVVAGATGVLFVIGFSIIGLPMAVPFGLFLGLLTMVPYLQTVGLIPALLLAGLRAIEGDSSFTASILLTLLVFAVAQVIQDTLLTPRIMGKATGLRPVAILLGVFVWGKLLGFLGVLVAIPLTCLGIAYYRRYVLMHSVEATKLPVET
ncbi:MAG: AI-2E family transporter [Planctomycetes bacterium]|nr:AI-2E family transporter [Planctomycetota bacterium]